MVSLKEFVATMMKSDLDGTINESKSSIRYVMQNYGFELGQSEGVLSLHLYRGVLYSEVKALGTVRIITV